ncbi:MAG: 3'-5' exonuclease [Deltaproteobacteria bacterium]|nr:3'-5' exonuclease [Deltaproteobacteria bacterium]
MSYLVFDIETRIDKGLVRSIYLPGAAVSDDEAFAQVRQQLLAEHQSDFFPLSFHLPIVIVLAAIRDDLSWEGAQILSSADGSGRDIAQDFWSRVESFSGTLVTFNGRGFDLPVMELQALRHGVPAPRNFNDRHGARARYSDKHYDLHEFITNFGMYRVRGGLDLLTKLIGLPGKTSVAGGDVQKLWEAGELAAIERYCQADVIQTYLLLLRVEQLRGRISGARLDELWQAAAPLRASLTG